jgi:hypothetical protein
MAIANEPMNLNGYRNARRRQNLGAVANWRCGDFASWGTVALAWHLASVLRREYAIGRSGVASRRLRVKCGRAFLRRPTL